MFKHPLALALLQLNLLVSALVQADEPRPIEFANFDSFCEGPVFDYEGNLFVSWGDSVARINPDGRIGSWIEVDSPNGHKVKPDGTHLLCVNGAVLHIDAQGRVLAKASSECGGDPLRKPNDLTLDSRGGFYFTDPGGSRTAPIGTVHYVDRTGKTLLVAGGLWVPNGLVLSPDGSKLYVAETVPNRILWYDVRADGTLGPVHILTDLPKSSQATAEPDGLAVDQSGRIYVAHLGMTAVQVLSPDGQLLRSLPAGNFDASNLVFDSKGCQLFITGSTGFRGNTPGRVYRLNIGEVGGISSLRPRP